MTNRINYLFWSFQASQHIVRLQRAIIQFKTENDSLRTALGGNTASCPKPHVAPCSPSGIPQYTNKTLDCSDCLKLQNDVLDYKQEQASMGKHKLHKTSDGKSVEYDRQSIAREQNIAQECELSLSKNRLHKASGRSVLKYDHSLSKKTSEELEFESPASNNRLIEATSTSLVDPSRKISTTTTSHHQRSYWSKPHEATSSSLMEYDNSQARKRSSSLLEYDFEPTHPTIGFHQALTSIDYGWRRFEHIKKFKPASSMISGFQPEGYHGIDHKPPTPPVSPEMVNHGNHGFRGNMLPAVTSSRFSLSACRPTCHQSSEEFPRLQLKPQKKIIFNSTEQGSGPEHARDERYKNSSQVFSALKDRSNLVEVREGREGKTKGSGQGTMPGKENYHGDLQSIIDAIHIIENPVTL